MPPTLRCAGCHSSLRMRPEYLGKKIRCPRCMATRSIPTIQPDDPPLLPLDDESPPPDPNDPAIDWEHPADPPLAEPNPGGTTEREESVGVAEYQNTDIGRIGRSSFLPPLLLILVPVLLLLLIGALVWILLS